MRKTLIPVLLSLLLASCSNSEELDVVNTLKWLNDAHPQADFEAAIARSDYRFIGVYGVGAYVPSVNIQCLDYDKDIRFIKGTSDALENYEHAKLNAIAQVYASSYNTSMLIYLTKHSGFECAL